MQQSVAYNPFTLATELSKFMSYQNFGLNKISEQSMVNGQVYSIFALP